MLFALALVLAAAEPVATQTIPNDTPVQLGLSLALTHQAQLEKLRAGQLDPTSPDFRRWLTPAEFGERFGQPASAYLEVIAALRGAGLVVTAYPSRAFVVASGTAAQVERLLGAQLAPVEDQPPTVHQLVGTLTLPPAFAPVVNISGLDTRVRYSHHIRTGNGTSMGPQDLRRFYGLEGLHAQGWVGQGQKLAVLSTALVPGADVDVVAINYFFTNISNVKTPFARRVIPNPGQDYDPQPGGAGEFELDVEMQSVGVPGADSITLVVSPASTVFTVGANDIANNLPDVTAVSVSLGICEAGVQQSSPGEIVALRNALIQGTMEGQTWSAATGDNGANDCRNGSLAADFPSVIPEFVAAGGSSIPNPAWNANHALPAYQAETAWNDGAQGGAAGGGLSVLYPRPAYQAGLGLPGTGRSVPDIALIAGLPAVAVSSASPPGLLSPVEGTSVSSPLSAGFFALIASRVGCRLGDVHSALYALGAAQRDGGSAVFHDITTGNLSTGGVTGPAAGPGYDSATGWGSLDVSAIAAAWPPCPTVLPDGGLIDAGPAPDAGAPYSPCATLGCDGGCNTLPAGPSTCAPQCTSNAACPSGSICSGQTVFSSGSTGSCVPGCATTADCAAQPGTLCNTCDGVCVAPGSAAAKVGDACASPTQCPNGGYCAGGRIFTDGYCTFDCVPNASPTSACGCPSGTQCGAIGRVGAAYICLEQCTHVGSPCRTGYVCQQQQAGGPVCLPTCVVRTFNGQSFDSCAIFGSSLACDVASGVCGGPPDAGQPDAGTPEVPDAGPAPAIDVTPVPTDLGAVARGCGCSSGAGPSLLAGLALLLARRRGRATAAG